MPTAKIVKVYTEEDGPNRLLGRPNGYSSKVAFADSRVAASDVRGSEADDLDRGGSIEVFADAASAKARSDYIQSVKKGGALGVEYNYLKGEALVRVTGNLTPTEARAYESALG